MSTNSNQILPVVIVGKDRTRMTCAVIDHLKEHIKNAKPYFICVSDRSRAGHDEVITKHLREIGETEFKVLRTSTVTGRCGIGAAMNIGLEESYLIGCNYALIVENDWILVRDLEMDNYIEAISNSSIAIVDFKWTQSKGEEVNYGGMTFLVRKGRGRGGCSYNVEFGCFLIDRRLHEKVGGFKEGEGSTNIAEIAFVRDYDMIPDDIRISRYLVVHDKELSHPFLNSPGCVFLHVGIKSQHENQPDWECPSEYRYLSDEEKDIDLCQSNSRVKVALVAVAREEDEYIGEWLKYHLKIGFDEIFIYQNEWRCKLPLSDNRIHWLIQDGTGIQMSVYNQWIKDNGLLFDYVAFLDIDEFLVMRNGFSLRNFLSRFSNVPAVYIPWRIFGDSGLSGKTLSFDDRFSTLKRFTKCAAGFYHLGKIFVNLRVCSTNQTLTTPHCMSIDGNVCPIICADGKSESRGFWNVPEYSILPCEIFHFRNKTMEELKKRKSFPRVFDGKKSDLDFQRFNFNDITDTSARDFLYEGFTNTILWEKHFDRIYCVHYLPQVNKLLRLKSELSRVGLLNNKIFEMRYTSPNKYDAIIWEVEKDRSRAPKPCIVNLCLEIRRILTEAKEAGYSNILLMENDVAFLRDLTEINNILENIPHDCDVVQFDKFVNDGRISSEYNRRILKSRINKYFLDSTGLCLTSAACFSLTSHGIEEMLRLMDDHIYSTDMTFCHMKCRRAVAVKNMAIQVFVENSYSIQTDGIDYMHKVYRNGGVNYSEYNLPDGYTYGRLYEQSPTRIHQINKKGRKFISVYAIAKNEESVAKRWYECVNEADEVCVLDTGSTDNTVKILRDLGARVEVKTYDEWSFAVARNDSMKLVSPNADILFTLDLDETIAPGWRKKLEDAWIAEQKKGNVPVGCLYKYIWSWRPDGTEAQAFSVRKIHANGTGKWKYRCHELLTEVDGKIFFLDDFVVEHHQNKATNRSKYLPLLEKDAKEMPNDDRSAYYYARELMYSQRWEEAKDEFKRHLALPSAGWRAERASSMRNIAKCYEHLNNEDARELWLWKSAAEDPTNREATYQLGIIAMNKNDYRTAVKVFEQCLAIEKPSLEYISDPMCWTAHPWFMYSQALWWTGHWREAVDACQKASTIEPNNPLIKDQLTGMTNTAKQYGVL